MTFPSSRLLGAGCVLLAALAAGCSAVRLAYDNAHWLALRATDGYLDLDDGQREIALAALKARFEAHRREQLPLDVAALGTMSGMLSDGLERGELAWMRETVRDRYRATVRHFLPAVTPVLASLDDAQIRHLEAGIEESNARYRREHAAPAITVRLERRTRRSVDFIEHWTGPLTPAQAALVAEHRDAMPLAVDDWLAYRRSKQLVLLHLLRKGAPPAELERFLAAWWTELSDRPAALEEKMRRTHLAWERLLLALDASLDPEQRARLVEKLDGYRRDLEALVPETVARR